MNAIEIRTKAAALVRSYAAQLGMDSFAADTLAKAIEALAIDVDPVPADVARLVVAARVVCFESDARLVMDGELFNELDQASEAFAERVAWDDQPEDVE